MSNSRGDGNDLATAGGCDGPMAEYEKDLAAIEHSGPHKIGEEQQYLNRQVYTQLLDIMPIDDIHKVNDADLIYRFLIARKWKVEETVKNMREYVVWRKEHQLNEILWQPLPEEAMEWKSKTKYQGFDRFGHPVFYDCPEPKLISQLLQKLPREVLLGAHFAQMEEGRRLCKKHKTDRISCVYDLSFLTMAIVANTRAVGFLKEIAKIDQYYYPENMRTMCLCNGGWTFNGLYKVIRPLLDVRVQKKIQFTNNAEQVSHWIDLDHVPVTHIGGKCPEDEGVLAEDYSLTAAGTPPCVLGEHDPHQNIDMMVLVSPGRASEMLDEEEEEEEEEGNMSFRSLQSDDEEEGGAHRAEDLASFEWLQQQRRSPTAKAPVPPPPQPPVGVVPPPTILSEALPKPSGPTFDFIVRTSTHGRRAEAFVEGDELLCYTTGQAILSGTAETLQAELLAEAGHPIHTYVIVVDIKRQPLFICKRRKIHNEIEIYQPQLNSEVIMKKGYQDQGLVTGERVRTMTCRPREGSHDPRDWEIVLHKDAFHTVQALKVGDTIRFQNVFMRSKTDGCSDSSSSPAGRGEEQSPGSAGGPDWTADPANVAVVDHAELLAYSPFVLFGLATALSDLWYFS